MKLLKIRDNSRQKKEAFSHIGKLTDRIADKTLEQLEREGVFLFPEAVEDAEDMTEDPEHQRRLSHRQCNGVSRLGR